MAGPGNKSFWVAVVKVGRLSMVQSCPREMHYWNPAFCRVLDALLNAFCRALGEITFSVTTTFNESKTLDIDRHYTMTSRVSNIRRTRRSTKSPTPSPGEGTVTFLCRVFDKNYSAKRSLPMYSSPRFFC